MKTKKLIDLRQAGSLSMTSGYASPEFNVVFADCENGFCASGIGTHSEFGAVNHDENGFWEE